MARADEQLSSLSTINTAEKAVIDTRYSDLVPVWEEGIAIDSFARIQLTDYKANHLTYTATCLKEQLAIFSEIFYDKGWNAYLNGELVPHFRANYIKQCQFPLVIIIWNLSLANYLQYRRRFLL